MLFTCCFALAMGTLVRRDQNEAKVDSFGVVIHGMQSSGRTGDKLEGVIGATNKVKQAAKVVDNRIDMDIIVDGKGAIALGFKLSADRVLAAATEAFKDISPQTLQQASESLNADVCANEAELTILKEGVGSQISIEEEYGEFSDENLVAVLNYVQSMLECKKPEPDSLEDAKTQLEGFLSPAKKVIEAFIDGYAAMEWPDLMDADENIQITSAQESDIDSSSFPSTLTLEAAKQNLNEMWNDYLHRDANEADTAILEKLKNKWGNYLAAKETKLNEDEESLIKNVNARYKTLSGGKEIFVKSAEEFTRWSGKEAENMWYGTREKFVKLERELKAMRVKVEMLEEKKIGIEELGDLKAMWKTYEAIANDKTEEVIWTKKDVPKTLNENESPRMLISAANNFLLIDELILIEDELDDAVKELIKAVVTQKDN